MQSTTKNKLSELQTIISRMPIGVFCVTALPEFGVRWKDMTKAVRNARLPMQPTSIARVLCKHVSKALSKEEIEDILARLRLKMVATQTRTWHVIRLTEKTTDEPVMTTIRTLPSRLMQLLRKNKRGMRPEVQTVLLGDLMYISLQLVSDHKDGSILYVATPPGEPVALVSTTGQAILLKACIEGLGYKKYENANLHGRDIKSLLRINNESWKTNPDHLEGIPEYCPIPTITNNGIDYTYRQYDEAFADNLLGPNPPLITDMNIKTTNYFFDRSFLDKHINLTVSIKTDSVAKTLKAWVSKGALAPTSDFFPIFREIKSNKISYSREDSD